MHTAFIALPHYRISGGVCDVMWCDASSCVCTRVVSTLPVVVNRTTWDQWHDGLLSLCIVWMWTVWWQIHSRPGRHAVRDGTTAGKHPASMWRTEQQNVDELWSCCLYTPCQAWMLELDILNSFRVCNNQSMITLQTIFEQWIDSENVAIGIHPNQCQTVRHERGYCSSILARWPFHLAFASWTVRYYNIWIRQSHTMNNRLLVCWVTSIQLSLFLSI
jgi:hypothetical protein